MPKLLKLSEDNYWSGCVSIERKDQHYSFFDIFGKYEIQAGRVSIGSYKNYTDEWYEVPPVQINFPKPFSKKPLIIISDSSDSSNLNMAGIFMNTRTTLTTTTNFKVNFLTIDSPGDIQNTYMSYIALVPLQDLPMNRIMLNGTLEMPASLDTIYKKMTEDQYWSLESIWDPKADTTLNKTYFAFDRGSVNNVNVLSGTVNNQIINFHKTFIEPPIVVCSLNSNSTLVSKPNTKGLVNVSVSPYVGSSIPTDWDYHKQARMRFYNKSGLNVNMGANWIAFGRVAEKSE